MYQFTKYLIFLKHLNFKKLLNSLKVSSSFLISVITREPIRWGMPISMSIEPTNFCNLQCPQCPVGLNLLNRSRGFIDEQLFRKIIDQVSPYLLNLFLYFQGEPFLHKSILDMIKYAEGKNIFTGLSTNGQLLTEQTAIDLVKSGLSFIIISMDGLDQKTYEKYRKGGSLAKVQESIINIQKAKKLLKSTSPYIEIQFLVLRHNEQQIKDFLQFCRKSKGISCKLKSAQIENFSTADLYIPQNKKYSRYYFADSSWHLKKKIKNHCWRLWNSAVITWDGQVVPCCYDKNAKYAFGNVKDKNLRELIKNQDFKRFAKTILTDRSQIDICRNCNE